MQYKTLKQLADTATSKNLKISDLVLTDQMAEMGITKDYIFDKFREDIIVMKNAIEKGLDKNIKSTSGLTGGDAYKLYNYKNDNDFYFYNKCIARGLAVSEYNASMGKIVACPTAGSCGIIPGTIISMLIENKCSELDAIYALLTSSAVGIIASDKMNLAGASGGCQAECGIAAAMAASGLTELYGGNPEQVINAAAIAIKSELGLVCDPVAGLVEIPCIKRNASSIAIAIMSSNMAISGIKSYIPVDECIDAMAEVGKTIPISLKETSLGGLANTKTAKNIIQKQFNL